MPLSGINPIEQTQQFVNLVVRQLNEGRHNRSLIPLQLNDGDICPFELSANVTTVLGNLYVSICDHCHDSAIWKYGKLVHPAVIMGPIPNRDLSDEIKNDFNEARAIVSHSPRGAAALLRLCVQKLCIELGESGDNINSDIASLVKKGLDPRIQKSLDTIRVIGNEAVHPGSIDIRDDHDTVIKLMRLVNIIADRMITDPKNVDEMFSSLPPSKIDAIEKRDVPKPPK